MNNNPITLALRPIQGLLLNASLEGKPLVQRAISQTDKGNVPIFYKGYRVIDSVPFPTYGHKDLDTDTAYKKDCYSEDTMGVSHTHNFVSKSLTVKKRSLFGLGVPYKF